MASFKPKLLFYDIETSPMLVETFGLKNQNHSINQIRRPGGVMCFAAKWYGEKKIHFHSVWDDGLEGMLKAMHDLWGQSEAVCGYNNTSFDNKKMKGQFFLNGMDPPPPVASIDLYRAVASNFSFDSHKLDYVCSLLGIGNKVQTGGLELWTDVIAGCEKAQRKMKRYNIQDVRLTEQLYHKIRPFINNHPHLGIGNSDGCPACGSLNAMKNGNTYTRCYITQQIVCRDCGHYYKGARKRRQVRDLGGVDGG